MEKFKTSDISRLNRLIDGAEHIVVTAHMTPDGDAIGSSMALLHILDNMGKEAKAIVPDAPSEQLAFLTHGMDLVVYSHNKEFADLLFSQADLIFCLDYNEPKRVDRMAPALLAATAPKVMIDHHECPGDFCDIVISRPKESSTCMLLFKVICALELCDAIDQKAAECILAGMMTDTGNFSFNNSNDPEIYRIVAELMERHVNRVRLTKLLFDTYSADCLRLNAYAIAEKMQVFPEQGAAIISLNREELNRYNYRPGYTEGLVNKPLAIPEVKYCVYLREETNYIKISMRSKGDFPCNVICKEEFGGGGHINAAGAEFAGTMDQAIEAFTSMLDKNYQKYIAKK